MLCVWQISFPSPRRISLLAPSTAWAGTAGFALPYLHRSFGLMETLHSPAKSRCGLHDAGMFSSAERGLHDTAGRHSACDNSDFTAPLRSKNASQCRDLSREKKPGSCLTAVGPMTPVAASNGTLNPAATGGTTPRNAGDRSPTGRVLGAGLGSTDRRPGYPFATILRSGMSRLLGFVDISPLPSWHPRSLASSSCTC